MPYGVGALEGESERVNGRLPELESGADARGPRPEYGPGEEPRPREGEPTASAHGELL